MSPEEKRGDECDDLLPRRSPAAASAEDHHAASGGYSSYHSIVSVLQLGLQQQGEQKHHHLLPKTNQNQHHDATTTARFGSSSSYLKSTQRRLQYLDDRSSAESPCHRRSVTIATAVFVMLAVISFAALFSSRGNRPLMVVDDESTNGDSYRGGGGNSLLPTVLVDADDGTTATPDFMFDYIVVGAGPAGIIVASRLAELRPDLQILLIEAGSTSQTNVLRQVWMQKFKRFQRRRRRPRQSNQNQKAQNDAACASDDDVEEKEVEEDILQMWPRAAGEAMWNEFDIPLFWSGAATSKKHHWPVELLGKAIGGSAIHNAMLYVRSLSSDWDDIPGWNFTEHILNEYQALESLEDDHRLMEFEDHGDSPLADQRISGRNGPLRTSTPYINDAIAPLFVKAAANAGYRRVNSFNNKGYRNDTVGLYEFNIRNGVRDSVAQALLGNAKIPDNLIIETDTTVTRVLLGPNLQAVGVEYVHGGRNTIGQFLLQERGEVILSAGALLTPQLLHNSGFNFTYTVQDHPVVSVGFNVDAEMAADEAHSSLYLVGHELNEYNAAVERLSSMTKMNHHARSNATDVDRCRRRLGAMGTPGFTAGAFLRSPFAEPSNDAPDIQLTVFPQQMEPHVVQTMMTMKNNGNGKNNKNPAMLVTVALLQPDAEFVLRPSQSEHPLLSMEAFDLDDIANEKERRDWERVLSYRLPRLDVPNGGSSETYLSDRDVRRLAWGIRALRKIQLTPPLSLHTGPEVYPATDDLVDYVRQNHLTNSHWCRSTPLGSAMVDARLRVAPSLRIVDAGVLPMVPNGNIHSTVCVVARRAATLILDDRRRDET